MTTEMALLSKGNSMNSSTDTVMEYVTAPDNDRSTIGVDFKHVYDNFGAVFVLYDEDGTLNHIGTVNLTKTERRNLLTGLMTTWKF